ncbi:DUF2249 domain-containing protein [Ralstonia solanacearum]|uniref:DUF2249 domain-containing protein n=2 Tax=Ralstonia solanacearum TaxID=305 RepID=A0AAW5ZRI5_RALSL|nr:DUF2249 domain-containing protein [Ralstonia solanacearum]AST35330.2 DUF2249 domain-containing protein [Ralstonia solanacearum]ATJ87860.1 aminotransferase [Ralstonia solanacearum]AYB53147.1 DUF2249 domain-containing protein [Ralstonia solanacearum]AYB57692.1 DUF2249 domain-containing protein [Ralstonia solanacearum]KFX28660.1 aminotransferase [Ralstonia solanacearum]
MTQLASTLQLDLRVLPPRERHPLIFSTFGKLEIGQVLELINDHDPRPLQSQFQVERPGQFSWNYLERGPHTWRVAIAKVASAASTGQCCGGCGGA